MRSSFFICILAIQALMASSASAADSEAGKKIFNEVCQHCHALSGEQKFAPNLKGIGERVDAEWLNEWLKDPGAMIKKDRYAQAIFGKNKYGLRMPKLPSMQDDQKRADVIAYLLTSF